MYDTARRVALVKKRVHENTHRKQRRSIYVLSVLCMFLAAALAGMAGRAIGQGQTAAQGLFGAMLLRADAGGYVLVAVISFAIAMAVTVLCIRLRDRSQQEKGGAGNNALQKQEDRKL